MRCCHHRRYAINTFIAMSKDEIKGLIVLAAVFSLGCLCGFFTGKAVYQPTYGEKVTRDTVRVTDTVPHYYPRPVEKQVVRYVTRLMPVHNTDTVTRVVEHFADTSKMIAVEVPIESRHYHGKEYDAWVSGYEPSLDSIKVYQQKEVITETITKTVKDKGKHFFLDVGAGCQYKFNDKTAVPYAEIGARVKLGHFGIGAYGGYSHDISENKASPYVRAKVSYDIVGF